MDGWKFGDSNNLFASFKAKIWENHHPIETSPFTNYMARKKMNEFKLFFQLIIEKLVEINMSIHFFQCQLAVSRFKLSCPCDFQGFFRKRLLAVQSGTLLVINGVTNNPTRSGSSPGTDLTAAPPLLAAEALFTSVCLQPHATIVCGRFASYSAVAGDDARSYVFLALATIF